VADWLIHVGPHGSAAFPLAATLEAARRGAVALAKRGLRLLRSKFVPQAPLPLPLAGEVGSHKRSG